MPLVKGSSNFSRLLSSRTFLIVNLIILSFLVFSFGREFARNYVIQQEIADLTAEKANLEAQNMELATLMSSVQTETYIEQEARVKLGLAKPGEKVVIFSGTKGAASSNDQVSGAASLAGETIASDLSALANPLKWWYYFFDINKFDMFKVYGNSSPG